MSIYTYKKYHIACESCTGASGRPIQVDFDGTNIQGIKIVLGIQRLARGYCFLSLRQFLRVGSHDAGDIPALVFAKRRSYGVWPSRAPIPLIKSNLVPLSFIDVLEASAIRRAGRISSPASSARTTPRRCARASTSSPPSSVCPRPPRREFRRNGCHRGHVGAADPRPETGSNGGCAPTIASSPKVIPGERVESRVT